MRYQISGKQIDIGMALQGHVKEGLESVFAKYAQNPTDAQVVFSKSGHENVCEATVHLTTGISVQATGSDNEIYAAFEKCADKMEKQLRRYKRRLKNHHKEREHPVELLGASAYVLASNDDEAADEPESLQPIIVAETEARIPTLSVGEAVMQMELAGAPVLVFRNEKSKEGVNVVYRRDDGNVGWIEPKA